MKKFNSIDLIIILSFAFFACLYQINRAAGNSLYLFHNSDGSNIASLAAASNHPDLFFGDELLENKGNSLFYSSLHILLAKTISAATGDYACAFTLLVGLHIFLMALGFYIFGRVIFQSRFWALLLAVMNIAPVNLVVGEFWGIYYDSLPRFTFQAILPFLLAAVFYWRSKPAVWPWLFFASGFLLYLYSLGVPCWILAIWLGSWLFLPVSWNFFKRTGFMFFLGLCFLLGASPFMLKYLGNHVHGQTGNYALISEIMEYRFLRGFLDASYAFYSLFLNPTFLRILIFGIGSIGYVWFYHRDERKKIVLVCMWIMGILIVSTGIPYMEQQISRIYKIIPFEVNFSRNLKYLFPLLLIFCLWPFVAITRNPSDRRRKVAFIGGFLLVFVWSSRQMYKHTVFLNEKGYFLLNPDKTKPAETMDMLNAIKRLTTPNSRFLVLASFPELAVRYYALRPLVYSGKDGGPLYYSNHSELVKWYEKARKVESLMKKLKTENDIDVKLKRFSDISRNFNAQFLLIDRKEFSDGFILSRPDIIYYNNLYILIKINET